jgi:hypothetical protein
MSSNPLVSPEIRSEASLANATNRPSAEIEGRRLTPFPCVPDESTLARSVRWAQASAHEPITTNPVTRVAAIRWSCTFDSFSADTPDDVRQRAFLAHPSALADDIAAFRKPQGFRS